MTRRPTRNLTAVLAVCLGALLLSACGGDGDDDVASDTDAATSTTQADGGDSTTTTTAEPTTTAGAVEPFAFVGSLDDFTYTYYDIESCTRSGDTGLVIQATSPDDPSKTLTIDAPSGSGTVELTEVAGGPTQTELDTSSDLDLFGLDPAPAGSVGTSVGPYLITVNC